MSVIECRGVSKKFSLGGVQVPALKDIDCLIEKGSWWGVGGASGSGKTTLLSLLAALDIPSGGQIFFEGQNLEEMSDVELTSIRKQRIGIIFQDFQLLEDMSGLENMSTPLLVTELSRKERERQARFLLEKVGMLPRAHHLPGQLSGGEQQRVAFARALVHDPDILIADEPTSNIDDETTEVLVGLLDEFHRKGGTIVVASHDRRILKKANHRIQL